MDKKIYQVSSEEQVPATTREEKIINSVVDKIREYVKNYDGIMLDYDGESASIHMGWDNFTDVEKEYAFDYYIPVVYNATYYLSKDNIIVRELLVEDYGIIIFIELDE